MDSGPRISLVIPAYNEAAYIGACLDAALTNSGGKLFEIIVIDNASTDNTAVIAGSRPGVRVVREEKKGLTKARERGFREAGGDILWYVDADTKIPAGWLERLVKEFVSDEHLACFSGPHRYYDIPRWQTWLVTLYWYGLGMPMYWFAGFMVAGCNFAIRRDVLEKMGGFDTAIEFYGEDTDIARRASKFGTVKFSPSFYMPTSGRRFRGQGLLKTSLLYMANFASEVFLHRPVTAKYKDIR